MGVLLRSKVDISLSPFVTFEIGLYGNMNPIHSYLGTDAMLMLNLKNK